MILLTWFRSLFRRAVATESTTSTEFSAEVVRIAEISPHGNADKLEVAKIGFASSGLAAYEVIIAKGAFLVGDLAAYFSVDCLLPLERPEFAFLKRPDSTKTIHRLRAARLRGRFSQGLLVPAPRSKIFGAPVAEHFGVSYHVEEAEEAAPNAGAKKTKPQAFPVYGVTSLKKAPNTFVEGEEVVVTCKIHGSNMRFGWVRRRVLGVPIGWRFIVGSHRVIKGAGGNHFYGEDVWLDAATRYGLARRTKDYRGHIFYGEVFGFTGTGKKIQDLTYGRTPEAGPGLVIFDVQFRGKWLDYFAFCAVCADVELDRVPVLYAGPYQGDLPLLLAEGLSVLPGAEKQIREGCVVASASGDRKAKYVGSTYLLRDEGKKK